MPREIICECGGRSYEDGASITQICPACGKEIGQPAASSGMDSLTRRLRSGAKIAPELTDTAPAAALPGSREWRRANKPKLQHPARLSGVRQYAYLALLAGLAPLFFATLQAHRAPAESIRDRLLRTIDAHPGLQERLRDLSDNATLSDLFQVLPDHRLDGAFLPRDTHMHYAFALASAAAYFVLMLLLFPQAIAVARRLWLTGALMGVVGVAILCAFQSMAASTQGRWVAGSMVFMIIFYVVKFLGYCYQAAVDPRSNLVLSFVAFTCAVAFLEEFCKSIPLLAHYRATGTHSWKLALLIGFASGVGFGISESIAYSGNYYNGIEPRDAYAVRFISCVALHAIWSGAAALLIYRSRDLLQTTDDKWKLATTIGSALIIPVVLHGMYDTLLKKDLPLGALITAAISFAFLVVVVEGTRHSEREVSVIDAVTPIRLQ